MNTDYEQMERRDMETQASAEVLRKNCARATAGLETILADIISPVQRAA